MPSRIRASCALLLAALLTVLAPLPASAQSDRIRRILRETPLIDGHNDVPEQYAERVKNHLDKIDLASDTSTLVPPMHTDIPRLKAGGVGGQFWSVYVSPQLPGAEAVQATLEQIDLVKRMAARYPDTFEMASTRRRHRADPQGRPRSRRSSASRAVTRSTTRWRRSARCTGRARAT